MSTSATARIDLRLPQKVKTLITQAAKAAGYGSVTEFLVQAALDKVDALHSREAILELPAADQRRVLELLSSTSKNIKFEDFLDRTNHINKIKDETDLLIEKR